MQYAFLLYPHQNIRYRSSLAKIAAAELGMTLFALGRECTIEQGTIGGAVCLNFETAELTQAQIRQLSQMAGVYVMFMRQGEALLPIANTHPDYVGEDLPALLKYKGKTNEMFTDSMIGMALAASDFMDESGEALNVCDPMAGRGTTLMLALRRGYNAAGIEVAKAEVKEAADYMTRYLEYHRVKHKKSSISLTVRGKQGGREERFVFADTPEHFKAGDTRTMRMICGDTRDAAALLGSESAHLMVADMPYGVQKGTAGRQDSILGTAAAAAPGWYSVLKKGGVLAVSFNTYVTKRAALKEAFERAGFEEAAAPDLEHWVEQAVNRDVLLMKRPAKAK